MNDVDDQLERAQADGRISVEDADQVRTFAAFLRDAPPPSRRKDGRYSAEDRAKLRAALWEHYPEDYPELNPERQP